MTLTTIDWIIIGGYMALSLAFGLYYTKRASSSTEEFFLSGRNLPWWLAGTSMVATTFSSDTPLYVTGLVREHGIYENWQWWCFLTGGMLSATLFAKLWKSAGVMTDVELAEIRYEGGAASVLRGFKAVYFSLFIHTIIKAQVILAMAKILDVSLGWSKWQGIIASSAVTIAYTLMSGYWGVIVTDFFQFIVAMIGAILLAYFAVSRAGGLSGLTDRVTQAMGPGQHYTDFFPPVDGGIFSVPVLTFIAYMGLNWWSKYSSDGGGVLVQRMVSCKSEKHAIGATFYFNVANYALRTWPWVLAAVASLVIYPAVKDHESVYPLMMVELLPEGLRGLMLASFLAAFMSTLSTYLNLSSAYFINDFYRRFVRKDAPERHYITITRVSMLALSVVTAVVTYQATSIVGIFKFLIAFGSGTGLVYIARWFWWRVNAWSEISAMLASTVMSSYVYIAHPSFPFYKKLSVIILFSTVIWTAVTLLTKPVSREHLMKFYLKARVGGPGWRGFELGLPAEGRVDLSRMMSNWLWGSLFIYAITIGTGMLLFGRDTGALASFAVAVVSGAFVYRGFR